MTYACIYIYENNFQLFYYFLFWFFRPYLSYQYHIRHIQSHTTHPDARKTSIQLSRDTVASSMHLSWAQVTLAEQQPSGGYYYLVLPPQRAESSEHGFRQNILLWPIAGPASSCRLTQSWICWLLDVVYPNYILKHVFTSCQYHVLRATISSISLLQTVSSASFVMFV